MSIVIPNHNPLYPALESASIAAWSGELPFSQRALAEALAPELGEDPAHLAQRLPHYLDVLASQGIYTSQRARYGAKTQGAGHLGSPLSFNWSSVAPEEATLRHVIEPFLTDGGVVEHRKHAVRSALRFGLELAVKCSDNALLKACDGVPASELYTLPRRVHDAALSRAEPLSKQTAQNHRSAIRGAMRYAAERRLIPIVFPQLWLDSAWERDKDRWFPLEVDGPTAQKVMSWRWAWTAFGETFADMYPELPHELTSVTRELAEAVISRMQMQDGRYALGYQARGAFRFLAKQHCVGPFAESSAADAFLVRTPSGPRPSLYLRSATGTAGDGDWDAFFGLLAEHGLPAELTEFLGWYREYVTLPGMKIITRRDKFPPRRERTMLDELTLNERIIALRAFLGAALYELKPDADAPGIGLALDPATLTPEVLFGSKFSAILGAMVAWWTARSDVLPSGALGKSNSGALRQMVIGLGMMALALYERLRHQRRTQIATESSASGNERINWREEEQAQKTPAEAAAWEAYRDAGQMADALVGQAKGRSKGRRAKRGNDFKDIREIVENTPPSYWIELLGAMVAAMRKAKRDHADHGHAYHVNVLNAFLLGGLISTGCRIEELCHVRLDIQANQLRTKRIIRLRAIDRKNGKEHDVLVQAALVPDDLLSEYLDRSRPWFISGRSVEESAGAPRSAGFRKSAPRKRAAVTPHEWLLISTSGREFGCREEKRDGTGRRKTPFKQRCGQAGQRFKVQMSAAAREANMPLPKRRFEFGPHAVRGSCGYGLFLLHGVQKAAHYLGDQEDTVRDAYSSINGIHVDASCLVGLDMGPQLNTGQGGGRRPTERASRLYELVDTLEAGGLDTAAFLRAIAEALGAPESQRHAA
jgi:integrase